MRESTFNNIVLYKKTDFVFDLVLQTPVPIIHSVSHSSFSSKSTKHCLSQTVRTRELKFLENVHSPPRVTCHIPHLSHVTCQISGVLIYTKGFCYQQLSVTAAVLKEPNRTHPGSAHTQTIRLSFRFRVKNWFTKEIF